MLCSDVKKLSPCSGFIADGNAVDGHAGQVVSHAQFFKQRGVGLEGMNDPLPVGEGGKSQKRGQVANHEYLL